MEDVMKRHKSMSALLMVILFALSMPRTGTAQRIYDKERDDQAQEAKKLAGDVTSGSLFDKQVKNLNLLSQQDLATYFLEARRNLRARINAFSTWRSVGFRVNRVTHVIGSPPVIGSEQVDVSRREVEEKITEARKALKRLETTTAEIGDPNLSLFFDRLGDFEAIQEFAETLLKQGSQDDDDHNKPHLQAVKRLTDMLDVLKGVYDGYTKKLSDINHLQGELNDLKVPLARVALQQLQVDEQHWKNIGAIQARRDAEEEDLQLLSADFQERTKGVMPGERIDDTINAAADAVRKATTPDDKLKKQEELISLLLALHTASALMARGDTPERLAEVRVAQEEHLYSIRHSALVARAYELTVSTGVQRLALYHKGGVKPELVAQVIHAAATVAIPPAILAK
jgi:hypothetical protein